MKVAILAGGMGTRLAEETEIRPKPMVEIGGRPILWHIMRYYFHFGVSEFVIALGYKGDHIRRFFGEYYANASHLSVDINAGTSRVHGDGPPETWKVDLIETGDLTETGGRLGRLAPFLGDSTFMFTYGDGLSDVDIDDLLAFHRSHGRLVTMTAVHPPPRFGHLELDGNRVVDCTNAPLEGSWINGAFMVVEPEVLKYVDAESGSFERGPLVELAAAGELVAYKHGGFWQCMDTVRDKALLEELWASGAAPWKAWD